MNVLNQRRMTRQKRYVRNNKIQAMRSHKHYAEGTKCKVLMSAF